MRIQCSGEIVDTGDKWLYDWFEIPAFCPGDLRRAIDALPEGEELVLEINSPGGNCYAGFETYAILRACGHPTVAEVQSWAASAASMVLMGCQTRRISPAGQVMVHDPWLSMAGNAADLRDAAQYLDSVKTSILNAYELGCRGRCDRQRLSSLMSQETWLPAQDAVALGLCDEVILAEGESAENAMPVTVAGSTVMNGAGCHRVEDLMRQYREAVVTGKREAAEGHPVEGTGRHSSPVQTALPDKGGQETKPGSSGMEVSTPAARGADENITWRSAAKLKIEKEKF